MSRAQLTSTDQQNSGGPVSPFVAGKNKIINGAFDWWQRGTSFSNPGVFVYTADRWQTIVNGAPTFTVSQQAFTPGNTIAGYEPAYFLRQNITAVSSSSVIAMQQPIEDVRTFAGQTVTFSFWAKADAARTWQVRFDQSFGSGGSSAVSTTTYNLSVTTSWQRYATTIAVPSISGKTIGAGSSLSAIILGVSNTVQTMDIWGVQVEAGSVATPFTTASGTLQGELALCKRYYQQSTPYGLLPTSNQSGFPAIVYNVPWYPIMGKADNWSLVAPFETEFRAAPSMAFYNTDGTSGYGSVQYAGSSNGTNGTSGVYTSSKYWGHQVSNFTTGGIQVLNVQWSASAEL
jgi:hypothetical protein